MPNDVFISYSHEDKPWILKLQKMLKPLVRNDLLSMWDDTQIQAGAIWRDEIRNALSDAKVAVLLVSDNFLASDFIDSKEMPDLFMAARTKGLKILWVLISDCMWRDTEIENYQSVHRPPIALDSLAESEVKTALREVCEEIKRALSPTLESRHESQAWTRRTDDPPPPPPPSVAQFGGTWRSADGSYSVVRQSGTIIAAEMYMNVFGFASKVSWGQGSVVGNQAVFDFMDIYNNSGRSEIMLSPDGQSISGVARYSNGFVTTLHAMRSM